VLEFGKTLQIPLPPISIQEEIVAEIEGYQKIIDGAKAVVAHYKPKIDINPDWEMVELGEVCDFVRGPFGMEVQKSHFSLNLDEVIYEQQTCDLQPIQNDFRDFVDESEIQ
jgi:type I restriction enzyme M protein